MNEPHPNDLLDALEWAVAKATEAAKTDVYTRLTRLPALQWQRDEVKREARNG